MSPVCLGRGETSSGQRAMLERLSDDGPRKVIDSIHTRTGMFCVDVVVTPDGFGLETCRRDEERWHVIARPGSYDTREQAVASARAVIATLE